LSAKGTHGATVEKARAESRAFLARQVHEPRELRAGARLAHSSGDREPLMRTILHARRRALPCTLDGSGCRRSVSAHARAGRAPGFRRASWSSCPHRPLAVRFDPRGRAGCWRQRSRARPRFFSGVMSKWMMSGRSPTSTLRKSTCARPPPNGGVRAAGCADRGRRGACL